LKLAPPDVVVFDVDGVLMDVRPSYYRIITEQSGATLDDIALFKKNGGFNDDWELARAAISWIQAGRPPEIFDGSTRGWADVIARCGGDPGDLSGRCEALYREKFWREERPMVPPGLLAQFVDRGFTLRACTGRNRWALDRAEELLGFVFPFATTSEDVRKPDPRALLRLLPEQSTGVVMLGDSEDDRRTVENARPLTRFPLQFEHVTDSPVAFLTRLLGAR
jgi:phosphoglycolate phosphatase-like HAD superfamily hydrolase